MDTPRLLPTSGTVLAVATLLLSACTTGGTSHSAAASTPSGRASANAVSASPLKSYYGQKLGWGTCKDLGSDFQCASMKVPLDYAHPNPATDIKLAVARKKATGPGARIGSLLVNPGGPGASAIDYAQYVASSIGFPAPVRARYDIVAVDPRGVGRSEPIECLTNRQMDTYTATDVTPDDQTEINKLVTEDKTFAQGCERRSGKLLGHVTTVDSARDMDILRALLGDTKLNYIGKSYGTSLGATYAGLFPKRVGRLVLDGAMDPSVSSLESSRAQAGGFEVAFAAFAKDCVARTDCPLGTKSVADAGSRLDRLLTRLDATPLRTGTSRRLTEALGTTGVIAAMYDQGTWPLLRSALAQAQQGDGSGLLRLSDSYYERDTQGHYANLMYANAAVNCSDLSPAFSDPASVQRSLPSFEKASPHFGRNIAWSSLVCGYWPVGASAKPHRIQAQGAAPILVVGTTRDPATPYAWARSLASQLSSGVLLTYNGDGHTAYSRGSDCIDTAVNRYLLQNAAPANGTRCN
jgi:pimeloyl-ACP methyl ester carboxylesterase